MPSGLNDTIVDAILDIVAGATADDTLLGATMYLDLLVTAATDDNGTGLVSWGQGRVAVITADGTNWPAASGRAKTGAGFTLPANASGVDIDVVAFAWMSTVGPAGGTYLGGGPLPGGTLTVPDGVAPTVTPTLSSPSPS